MPRSTSSAGSVRPRAVVNAAIRAFLRARCGRGLRADERLVYEALRAEWLAAERRDRWGAAA